MRLDETAIHAIVQCPVFARKIWEIFEDYYVKVMPDVRFVFEKAALTINVQHKHHKDKVAKLSRTLTEQIIYEIWTSRCKMAGKEKRVVNVERSLKSIKTKLSRIIRTYYRFYQACNNIKAFEDLFCINKAIEV